MKKQVCLGHDIARATSPSTQLLQEASATPNGVVASNAPTPDDGSEKESRPYKPRASLPAHISELQEKPTRQYSPRKSYGSRGPYGPRNSDAAKSLQTEQKEPGPSFTPMQPAQRPRIQSLKDSPADSDLRLFPSELDPDKMAQLDTAINAQEAKYAQQIASLPATLSQLERDKKLLSLKQGNATKKSQIRKKFGVTLRQRIKDKDVKETNSTPIVRPSLDAYRAPGSAPGPSSARLFSNGLMHNSSPLVHQTSGFSPINIQKSSGHSHPQSTGSPSQHINQGSQQPVESYAQPQSNKRRRTDEGSREGSGSNFGMMELSSEDAASRMTKKVPIEDAQARWEQMQPKNSNFQVRISHTSMQDTPMMDAPVIKKASQDIVTIIDSEDEEVSDSATVPLVNESADQVLPSVEAPEIELENGEMDDNDDDDDDDDGENEILSQTASSKTHKMTANRGSMGRGRGGSRRGWGGS